MINVRFTSERGHRLRLFDYLFPLLPRLIAIADQIARERCPESTQGVNDLGYFNAIRRRRFGGFYVSRGSHG